MNVHVDEQGRVLMALGEFLPDIDVGVVPGIDAGAARRRAIETIAAAQGVDPGTLVATMPVLSIYNPILVGPGGDETRLAWRVDVAARAVAPIDELVMVDALDGSVLLHFNQVPTARVRQTFNAGNGTTLPGSLVCGEGDPACAAGDAHAQGAHLSAGDTYDFYATHHGRDSVDGLGMTLVSSVHYSTGYANAFWNPVLRQMVYGDAYGFPLADDVVAHELTHGVTSMESALMYYYESGAINECFSDVWGELVDQTNGRGNDAASVRWLIGEDVLGMGAARNMKNPPAYNQPDRMSSILYAMMPADNGGVHTNSGVGNKTAFLMTDGGTFNLRTVAGLGLDKVAAIFYEVQTNILVGGSDYADLHDALYQGCLNLTGTHGLTAGDCAEVLKAVDAVEMDYLIPGFYGHAAVCPAGQAPSDIWSDNIDDTRGAHFTETVIAGQSAWLVPWNSYPASGQWHLIARDDVVNTDAALAMNLDVPLPAGIPYLHFSQAIGMHSDDLYSVNYHGGVIEYSTNGGATWTDGLALFESGGNGYNGWITDGGTNPLRGRAAWVGKSRGYITSRLNLASLAGHNARFRWRLGTDNAGADSGWSIDDLRIYTCVPAGSGGCNEQVADGGFEGGTPSVHWTEASANWGSPLCDNTRCGILSGAHGGVWYVGFGRKHMSPETGSVQQSVTIPVGSAHLTFWARIFMSSGNQTDFMRALVDGTEIFKIIEGDPAYTLGYVKVDRDLAAWADGGSHVVRFESATTGQPFGSTFMLDDVSLQSCPAILPGIELQFTSRDILTWQPPIGFDSWNLYRGDLDVLKTTGEYTQVPGSDVLAWKDCALAGATLYDPDIPAVGKGAFYHVTGVVAGVEGSLGTNSAGAERPRTHTCP
jgi:hypothetical protein